jgi:multimeric flavodoxin WrbA
MSIIGINGSPRKGWNAHLLVEKALALGVKLAEQKIIVLI